jgi:hypothetical protein
VVANFLRTPPPPKDVISPHLQKRSKKSETPAASNSEARREAVVLSESPKAEGSPEPKEPSPEPETGAASGKTTSSKNETKDSASPSPPTTKTKKTKKLRKDTASNLDSNLAIALANNQLSAEQIENLEKLLKQAKAKE